MKQYISKSDLVAEIEKLRKNALESFQKGNSTEEQYYIRYGVIQDILSLLDTPEVKEGNDSEKDEDYINDLIDFFHQNNKLKNTKTDIISWLKSLKDRAQPQSVEYYDPYKAVVESIAEMCVRYDKASHSSLEDFYDNVRVKCKDAKEYESLFPREQWKPSEEQLKALSAMKEYCDLATSFDVYSQEVVESLYQDLKKLKGE